MKARFLITGGAGFIASHLADALLEAGHSVHALDDLSTGSMENIRHLKGEARFEYTIDSASNSRLVAELVDEADAVYHLAAAVGVELIVESPVRTIETNVHTTEIVLKAASKKKRPVFVASTSTERLRPSRETASAAFARALPSARSCRRRCSWSGWAPPYALATRVKRLPFSSRPRRSRWWPCCLPTTSHSAT